MRGLIIIILFIIVFGWLAFSSGQTHLKDLAYFNLASVSQAEKAAAGEKETETAFVPDKSGSTLSQGKTIEPSIKIETIIINGPQKNEIIEGTDKIVFEFEGVLAAENSQEKIFFETKVLGLDKDWQKTYSQKRTVKFPAGPKEYTFMVRARTKNLVDTTPAQITFRINNSLYFGKIKISSVKKATSSKPSLITLSTYLATGEEINLTGWQIKGKTGIFFIPQGIEKYVPYSGYYQSLNDIIIKKGDKIYLSSSTNPLGKDRNFRPNKCLGYVAQYSYFAIPFNKNCPKPDKEEIYYLNACCKALILKTKSCQTPNYSENPETANDAICVSYIVNNFNYAGCYQNYSDDDDFLEKSWHIYLDRDITVSNDWDTIYLRDKNGSLVAKYDYGRPSYK